MEAENGPAPGAGDTLRRVAAMLPSPAAAGRRVFVGIDGVDGSGKTTFADALAASLQGPVVRVSIDGFHLPRRERYRQGRDSPRGFWEDSYDYGAFLRLVVEPLRPGGTGAYSCSSHDLDSDLPLAGPKFTAPELATVLVDGLFLHRPELAGVWDCSVFLDVSLETSCGRMALRDGSDPDPQARSNRRYVLGQKIYLSTCDPRSAAEIVVDNNDYQAPRVLWGSADEMPPAG
ncbi:uridine kinase [Arthrobacter sp. Edens01]|uniref:uridine kinase n=1 Tax=Arthrobacter sp. Edens01 TaxID=1732020 RepID=UPI001F1DF8B2|nr:uridine kinase [Arthrobacter sp. Edens01]